MSRERELLGRVGPVSVWRHGYAVELQLSEVAPNPIIYNAAESERLRALMQEAQNKVSDAWSKRERE